MEMGTAPIFIMTAPPYGDTTFIEKLEQKLGYRLRGLPRE
jgi:hypothetical protein